jgi:ABC-type transporter Mla subunit MlaD
MSVHYLKESLEQLERDFRDIPDVEKDFLALQDRLEVLLKKAAELTDQERQPLVPLLKNFQSFLKEHLEGIQKQAAVLQVDLQDRTTHIQATQAYGRFKK